VCQTYEKGQGREGLYDHRAFGGQSATEEREDEQGLGGGKKEYTLWVSGWKFYGGTNFTHGRGMLVETNGHVLFKVSSCRKSFYLGIRGTF